MKLLRAHPWYSEANAQRIVSLSFLSIAIIGVVNAVLLLYVGLEFVYLIPLVIAAPFLSRWQLLTITGICTAFAEGFSHLPHGFEQIPRVLFIFVTFAFVSLLVREMVVYRRAATRHMEEIKAELSTTHDAVQRLEQLVNSSAIGMMTLSSDGTIVDGNRAAHEILGVGFGDLTGKSISCFMRLTDSFHNLSSEPLQQVVQTSDGKRFAAQIWTSVLPSNNLSVTSVFIALANDTLQQSVER